MSDLLNLQLIFPQLISKLITYAYQTNCKLTFGEAWRTPEQAAIYAQEGKGVLHSEHINKLAVDFSLFVNVHDSWVYQTDSAAYAGLGAYWKTLHPLARWGGDFTRKDGNHFSLEYQGVQ